MNIEIFSKIKTNLDQDGLFDLFEGYTIYRLDIPLLDFEVQDWEEMRIDLIFQRMYNLEPNEVNIYLAEIDVILFINQIDNPLNIKKGMFLKYPELGNISKFRYLEDENSRSKTKTPLLAVPNVSTKKDNTREKYKKNGFSLPPVALAIPKPPIRQEDGVIKIGGL